MNPIYVIIILACVVFGPAVRRCYIRYQLRKQVLRNLNQQYDLWIERAYREYDGR